MGQLKTCIGDLAIMGGAPAFQEPIFVGRPHIPNRERLLQRINTALDSGRLTNHGPLVREFERNVAEQLGVKHCIATCNGTVALQIAVRALRLSGEVIIPSFTFVATAHALQWQGITPVFCDVDPDTHAIDPCSLEKMITSRTTGVLAVHLWGNPCDIERISEITERHRLKLLFDAAHAFGCSYKGRMIGNFGNAEVFSFHATKFLNTFEGGAVVTNDDSLAAQVRLMTNFGLSGDAVDCVGTNGKMNEISAAMGITGLETLDEVRADNLRYYQQYELELKNIPGVKLLAFNHKEQCNYQYIVLEIDRAETQVSRDRLIHILRMENVMVRRYFHPGCHQLEPYRTFYPHAGTILTETEKLAERVLCLPTGSAVTSEDITVICQILTLALTHAKELSPSIPREETLLVEQTPPSLLPSLGTAV
jgi:dTDP-4-amino-4,6-dideoxygalactose transaminase